MHLYSFKNKLEKDVVPEFKPLAEKDLELKVSYLKQRMKKTTDIIPLHLLLELTYGEDKSTYLYTLYVPKKEFQNKEKLREAEVVFICVPTPMKPSGEIDYSAIHDSLEMLKEITSEDKRPLVVIRSTAVSGTTDDLEGKYPFHFVFNPEFLTERNALEDQHLETNLDYMYEKKNKLIRVNIEFYSSLE